MTEGGGASVDSGLDHATRWFGLRFANGQTERRYRQWRIGSALSFARIGYVGSIPSWFFLGVAIAAFDSGSAAEALPPVAGWIVLLVVLTWLTYRESLRRTVMPVAALANCVAGFLIVWLLFDVVRTEQTDEWRAGIMTAGLLIVMFFGFAVFRVPPLLAVAAVTPYMAYATYRLAEAYADGRLSGVEAAGFGAGAWIAYLGGVMVCVVTDVVTRRAFCQDQIIDAQQRELHRSREAIGRYLPPAVAKHIVAGNTASISEPSRRRVTVLFIDMVGFTMLADRVEAEVLALVINDYMATMTRIVDEGGGTVSEFGGDGFLALFGAPDPMDPEEQAVRAVQAAQKMQACLPALQEGWYRLGATEPLSMRVGINSGVLSVGSFGSGGRMLYTAMGVQANIGQRIQTQCPPGGILISDASWHLLKDRVRCEPRGEVACRGVHYPVRVHEPVTEIGDDLLPPVAGAPGTREAPTPHRAPRGDTSVL